MAGNCRTISKEHKGALKPSWIPSVFPPSCPPVDGECSCWFHTCSEAFLEQRCLFALFKSQIPQDVLAHRDVLVPQPPLPPLYLMGVAPNLCAHDPFTPWRGMKALRYFCALCVQQRELMSYIKYKYPCSTVVFVSDMQKYYKKQTPRSRRAKSLQCYIIGG